MPEALSRMGKDIAKAMLLAPILAYRYTLSALAGGHCRHVPTCSDFAREAIETNGAWRGGWLTLSRLCRCHPWGSHGLDPVPDLLGEHHPLAPWRYGRWHGPEASQPDRRGGKITS